MKREIIDVPVISKAIRNLGAPTSAIVRCDGMVFTCGMPPIDPVNGQIVAGTMREQTTACMDALKVALEYAGSSIDDIVKAVVYVSDPDGMGDVNAVYQSYFTKGYPARTSATIHPWKLPFNIEIECVAIVSI
ncbi:RidA family protein [Bartonella sp. LJL80]